MCLYERLPGGAPERTQHEWLMNGKKITQTSSVRLMQLDLAVRGVCQTTLPSSVDFDTMSINPG